MIITCRLVLVSSIILSVSMLIIWRAQLMPLWGVFVPSKACAGAKDSPKGLTIYGAIFKCLFIEFDLKKIIPLMDQPAGNLSLAHAALYHSTITIDICYFHVLNCFYSWAEITFFSVCVYVCRFFFSLLYSWRRLATLSVWGTTLTELRFIAMNRKLIQHFIQHNESQITTLPFDKKQELVMIALMIGGCGGAGGLLDKSLGGHLGGTELSRRCGVLFKGCLEYIC